MSYLTPDAAGYFALGYDNHIAKEIPVWSANNLSLQALAPEVLMWVSEAIEWDGHRYARVYYMDDGGHVKGGPDILIETGTLA